MSTVRIRILTSHLDCMLKLLVFFLELLSLLQGTGCDEAGVQHGLAITDPTQHLAHTHIAFLLLYDLILLLLYHYL